MIAGVVNARNEAVVRLRVRGAAGLELDVDTVIDSGFTDRNKLALDSNPKFRRWLCAESESVQPRPGNTPFMTL